MPPVSERQRRAMEAAAHGHSTLGIPKAVGKKFVSGDEEFKEDDHPRSPDGKFGSGGGSEKPKVNKKREKKARQGMRDNLDYTGNSLRATYGGLNEAGTHYEPISDPKMKEFADIAEAWASEVANEGAPYDRGPAAAIAYFANNYGLDTGDAVDRDAEVDEEFARFAETIKGVGDIKADAGHLDSAMDDVLSNVTEGLNKVSKPLQKQMDKLSKKVLDEDWFAPGDLENVKTELEKFRAEVQKAHEVLVQEYVDQSVADYLAENPGEEFSEDDIAGVRSDAEDEVETSELIDSLDTLDAEIVQMRDRIAAQEAALDAATPKDESDGDYVSEFLSRLGEDAALTPSRSVPAMARRRRIVSPAKYGRMRLAQDGLAFDRGPEENRTKTEDGRLLVRQSNFSKANTCPYVGEEIPDWESLGLDPKKIYYLYRDPGELKKAARTFDKVPLLLVHKSSTADDHPSEVTIGTTGENTKFDAPYLIGSLAIWVGEGVTAVESGRQCELSCGYRYDADMTPGRTPDGVPYDGVMRNIRGNHVAIVEDGRAGDDVVVGDTSDEVMWHKIECAILELAA